MKDTIAIKDTEMMKGAPTEGAPTEGALIKNSLARKNVLTLNNVTYHYEGAKKNVLKNVNASFATGKIYTIVGKSGAGKSTLLSLISGLDIATSGDILCGDEDLKKADRDKYRAQSVGVIFQGYNLLTNATAVQNIVLSMNISQSPEKDKKTYAYSLLERMGIDRETADRKILKLSGGEQQRVGIARALAHNPAILIADEPTGNLDKETENDILDIFKTLAHKENRCVIIVTHSRRVTAIADVVYGIKDGSLSEVKTTRQSDQAASAEPSGPFITKKEDEIDE